MTETDIYTVFKENKQLYLNTLSETEALFDRIAQNKRTDCLSEYDDMTKKAGNIRTGVTYRYDCIKKILELESRNNSDEKLYARVTNHAEFQNAYITGIMLLRRLEISLPDMVVKDGIKLLREQGFSIYFYLVILNNELFEKKWLVANKVFDLIFNECELLKRIDILNKLSMFMRKDDFLLRAASLSIEANDFSEAISLLKKIEDPSDEVASLLKEMES